MLQKLWPIVSIQWIYKHVWFQWAVWWNQLKFVYMDMDCNIILPRLQRIIFFCGSFSSPKSLELFDSGTYSWFHYLCSHQSKWRYNFIVGVGDLAVDWELFNLSLTLIVSFFWNNKNRCNSSGFNLNFFSYCFIFKSIGKWCFFTFLRHYRFFEQQWVTSLAKRCSDC